MLLASASLLAAAPPVALSAPTSEFTPVRSFRSFDRRTAPGLPQSTVYALLQDERGLLWVATLGGLGFFDGRSVQGLARDSGGPVSGPTFGLTARRGGGVLACAGLGVYVYDGSSWSLLETPHPALAVANAQDGALWLVDQDGEVFRRAAQEPGAEWQRVELPGMHAPALMVQSSRAGRIYVATTEAVYAARGQRLELLSGALPEPIATLLVAASGTLWVGAQDGELFHRRPDADGWTRAQQPPWDGGLVRVLAEDRHGRIWAGGNNGRVAFGREGEPFSQWSSENGLRATAVTAILADREGTLWFGYNGNGLQQWVGEAWSHRTRWDARDAPGGTLHVFGLSRTADGGFLAAVYNRGVWRWDGRRLQSLGPEAGLHEDILQAVEPEPGTIWAGGRFGLYESRQGAPFRKLFSLPRGFVSGLFRSPAGRWYATTNITGVYALGPHGFKPEARINQALPDLNTRTMAWLKNGQLWVGGLRGLTVFDSDGSVVPAAVVGLEAKEAVNAVRELRSGDVWVAGFGGLSVRQAKGGVRRFGRAEGLPGETVYSLAEAQDGSVWVGGSEGVAHWDGRRFTRYGTHNGLLDGECNSHGLLPGPDGSLLVGTMGSLARFSPSSAPTARPGLHLYVTEPQGLSAASPFALPLGQRRLHLAWVAPWLTPEPVEYRTRLPGLDDAWGPASLRNELELTGLAQGTWRVEVQARVRGSDGQDFTEPLVIELLVPAFWHETRLARVGLVLLGLLAVAGLVRLRTAQLARRAARLDQAVASRTAELLEANRRLRQAQESLQDLALHDALTGLYNRRAADERLHEIFAASKRQEGKVALLLFDLDYLKETNDSGGHAAGDTLLKRTAEAARRCLRQQDVLARYGGDEFLAILPGSDEDAAAISSERLRQHLAELAQREPWTPPIVFSAGVAAGSPSDGLDVEALLRAADRALYAAKRGGRNSTVRASALSAETAGEV